MQRSFVHSDSISTKAHGKSGNARAGVSATERTDLRRRLTDAEDNVTDYDCDGDGVDECGSWDYSMSMCRNQYYCGHLYKFPDGTLDKSCRCRRCSGAQYDGTAISDPNLTGQSTEQQLGSMYWGRFKNWADHMDTCTNWLMPRNDTMLQNLLQFARDRGYRVRIGGAAHSAGGIVTDGKDKNAFVISLAEYVAPGDWEFSSKDMPDGSMRATANAGWTQLHLYERVRPLGFFLPAQTAGYFFSLGGIVASSVHGGSYLAGFIHSYVTKMRVMKWDGSIEVIEDEAELKYWRCSFGLLGVMLSIEFQLEQREQMQMYSVERSVANWTSEEFWTFIKQDAEANLPDNLVPADGGVGSKKSWNGEYFIDFINGGDTPTMSVYAQKANSSVDADGDFGIPADIVNNYAKIKNRQVEDGWHGVMSWGEAARRDGAPPIMVMGIDVNDMLSNLENSKTSMARTMSSQALSNIPRLAQKLANKVNDGFFLTHSPAALAAAYFVRPEHAFAAMDFLKTVQQQSIGTNDFVWNLPGEFRFINVQDSAVLQPIEAGVWFNTQMISFADLARNDQAWKKDFMRVEQNWLSALEAKPHMGKLFGFHEAANGEVEPFSPTYSCTIYTAQQKANFEAKRAALDPHGLFASGLGMEFLQECV